MLILEQTISRCLTICTITPVANSDAPYNVVCFKSVLLKTGLLKSIFVLVQALSILEYIIYTILLAMLSHLS